MKLIIVLGPTATGKTNLAANLALTINGEVISADSRQVYRDLEIGAGKDLNEYIIGDKRIPYHLIDIRDINDEYNLFEFQRDFYNAYEKISINKRHAILCGGTGLYLETALAEYQMVEVPVNVPLRKNLEKKSSEELGKELKKISPELHNTTDLIYRDRTIRAIEIEQFKSKHSNKAKPSPINEFLIFGIRANREQLRERIKIRLDERLKKSMIEEVEGLIIAGVEIDQLKWLGLEYRYIASYLNKEINYETMYEKLLQAIRRFAKKQMTWFRRMEKNGYQIHWIDIDLPLHEKIAVIKARMNG